MYYEIYDILTYLTSHDIGEITVYKPNKFQNR